MENNFNNIGVRLRKIRIDNNLNQTDFAKIMGYSKPEVVSYFETGKRFPGVEALSRLTDALQVDLHWLITGENYNPQKRLENHLRDVSKQYNALVMEHEQAQEVVSDLEAKKASGVQLTPEQQQQYLQNRGRTRILLRTMEQYIKQQAEILKAMQQPPQEPL